MNQIEESNRNTKKFLIEQYNSLNNLGRVLKSFQEKVLKLAELSQNNSNNSNNNEIDATVENLNADLEVIRTSLDSLSNLTEISKTQLLDDIGNYYTLYQEFLSTLTIHQHEGLIHLIFIFVLFILIFNLATIFYGESLIKYFELTKKFPKLAHLIQLRSKFQQYYFAINLILIIIILLVLTFVNIIIFFNLD